MTIFQILILIFIAIVLYKAVRRLIKKDISALLFAVWLLFWLAIAAINIYPESMNIIARALGVGRGVDIVIYVSVFVMFYWLFRTNLRLNEVDRKVSKLVSKVAVENYIDGRMEK